MYQFRLNNDTISYIEEVSKKENISKTKALETIIQQHSELKSESSKIFANLVSETVYEKLKKDLTRIRLGSNNADRNSQVTIELLQGMYAHFDILECITTDVLELNGLKQAKETVKKRIEAFRQKKLEKEQKDKDTN